MDRNLNATSLIISPVVKYFTVCTFTTQYTVMTVMFLYETLLGYFLREKKEALFLFISNISNSGFLLLLHFVVFFYVASLFSTGVDSEKVGVDNEKALELTNTTVFHRGRR